jgi:hypothetical protein
LQEIFDPVAHLACKQRAGFLSLLALCDVEENAKHQAAGNIFVVTLTPSGNPTNVSAAENSKIDLVGTYDRSLAWRRRPIEPFQDPQDGYSWREFRM